jgi:hypothetical protein
LLYNATIGGMNDFLFWTFCMIYTKLPLWSYINFRWNFLGGSRQTFEARRVFCMDISLEHTHNAPWERKSEEVVGHKRFHWKYLLGVVISTRGNSCLEENKQQKVLQLEVRSYYTGLVNGFCWKYLAMLVYTTTIFL